MRNRFNPQLLLSASGLLFGLAYVYAALTWPAPAVTGPTDTPPSGLRVSPSSQPPGSTLRHLQPAGILQQQTSQNLQSPIGDQLHPNAKTDGLEQSAP